MKLLLRNLYTKLRFSAPFIKNESTELNKEHKDPFKVQERIIGQSNKKVIIFDVGAFNGGTAVRYKKLFPSSKIYAFEPFPDSFSQLVKNTSEYKDIIAINKGVSEELGTSTFNSNSFAQTNSLLNSHQSSKQVWGEGLLETLKTIEVELTTIDQFVQENEIEHIDILKLDVQGAEYKVINGAKETLKKGIVQLIYTEIITLPTYEGQLDFEEVISLIKSYGFKLYSIYNLSFTDEGKLRQVDAIFINTSIKPKNL